MPAAPPSGAILWLHDLGERDPTEFSRVAAHHVPWLNIHCPAAPIQHFAGSEKPVYAWFSAAASIRGEQHTRPEGLDASVKYVHERIEHLQSVLRLGSERIVVAGFGQGGALALAAALSYRKKLAGVVCHSGYVCQPRAELLHLGNGLVHTNADTPVMIIHGNDDEVVDPSAGEAAASVLRACGASQVILRTFEDVEHKMAPDTLSLLVDFVRSRLPVDPPAANAAGAPNAPAAAKSRTVIKMNGRNKDAAPTMAPAEPAGYAAGRPTPVTDGFAVFANAKGGAARIPPQPMVQELGGKDAPPPPKPAAPKPAAPKPAASKPAAPAAPTAAGGGMSDAATAKALASGDTDALKRALEARGDEKPLSEAEMVAIAKCMLGNEPGTEDALKDITGFARAAGQQQQQQKSQTPAPPHAHHAHAPPHELPMIDSDDEEADADAAADVSDAPPPPPVVPPTPTPTLQPTPPPTPVVPAAVPPAPASDPSRYKLSDDGSGVMVLTVWLPATVTGMAQLSVEIASSAVDVDVHGESYVRLPLPRAVSADDARAKFVKKAGELRISAPYA